VLDNGLTRRGDAGEVEALVGFDDPLEVKCGFGNELGVTGMSSGRTLVSSSAKFYVTVVRLVP
jgi:hypothetical protein